MAVKSEVAGPGRAASTAARIVALPFSLQVPALSGDTIDQLDASKKTAPKGRFLRASSGFIRLLLRCSTLHSNPALGWHFAQHWLPG